MARPCLLIAVLVLLAGAASGATLTLTADQGTYAVGETITLTAVGDSEGAAASGIFGRIDFPALLVEAVAASQTQHTSLAGTFAWSTGFLALEPDHVWMFNQVCCITPRTVDQLQIATATLIAQVAGPVSVSWHTFPNDGLTFFGLVSAPGTSFLIVPAAIPEPATAGLLALGLAALAAAGRGRAA